MTTNFPGRSRATRRAAARPGNSHRALRVTAAGGAAALTGIIALAGCGSSTAAGTRGAVPHRAAYGGVAIPAPSRPGSVQFRAVAGSGSAATTSAPLPGQDIIYTATLTVRIKHRQELQQKVTNAVAIATRAGGYTASEQMSTNPGSSVISAATVQLQIPVAGYQAAFDSLSGLGKAVAVSRQAQTVTTQVADVASRVGSARAAIAQLRALLAHAGSVGALLSVQDQINSQESALESLLAQQRALAHQTSYATVTLQLVTSPVHVVKHKVTRRGFIAGIAAGWRAFRVVIAAVLTAVGAALPFAVVVALLGGLLLGGQRQLKRRRARPAS